MSALCPAQNPSASIRLRRVTAHLTGKNLVAAELAAEVSRERFDPWVSPQAQERAVPPPSPIPRAIIRRMWRTGPLRWWAPSRPGNNWISYEHEIGGFVASYVCDRCRRDVDGVYRIAPEYWTCGTCRRGSR